MNGPNPVCETTPPSVSLVLLPDGPGIGTSLASELREFLRTVPSARGLDGGTGNAMARPKATHRSGLANGAGKTRGKILPFPVYGEALLTRLAELLRERFAGRGPSEDPLRFELLRCPGSRLEIDRAASAEFCLDRSGYRLTIEASSETQIILATASFDALVDFVVQYVGARLAEGSDMERAR